MIPFPEVFSGASAWEPRLFAGGCGWSVLKTGEKLAPRAGSPCRGRSCVALTLLIGSWRRAERQADSLSKLNSFRKFQTAGPEGATRGMARGTPGRRSTPNAKHQYRRGLARWSNPKRGDSNSRLMALSSAGCLLGGFPAMIFFDFIGAAGGACCLEAHNPFFCDPERRLRSATPEIFLGDVNARLDGDHLARQSAACRKSPGSWTFRPMFVAEAVE